MQLLEELFCVFAALVLVIDPPHWLKLHTFAKLSTTLGRIWFVEPRTTTCSCFNILTISCKQRTKSNPPGNSKLYVVHPFTHSLLINPVPTQPTDNWVW